MTTVTQAKSAAMISATISATTAAIPAGATETNATAHGVQRVRFLKSASSSMHPFGTATDPDIAIITATMIAVATAHDTEVGTPITMIVTIIAEDGATTTADAVTT